MPISEVQLHEFKIRDYFNYKSDLQYNSEIHSMCTRSAQYFVDDDFLITICTNKFRWRHTLLAYYAA